MYKKSYASILFLLVLCSCQINDNRSDASSIALTDIKWFYKSVKSGELKEVKVGINLPPQIGLDNDCCSGSYSAEIDLLKMKEKIGLSEKLGILLPATGGLKSIYINGEKEILPHYDYSSVGPIISLNSYPSVLNKLNIVINIEYERNGYAGMWKGDPILGRIQELAIIQQEKLFWQKIVPLFEAIFLFTIFLVFLWLRFKVDEKKHIYNEFVFSLFTWFIFYIFLSGEIRLFLPRFNFMFYFPARALANLALFRLVYVFSDVNLTVIRRISLFYVFLILVQIGVGFFERDDWQVLIFIAMNFMSLYGLYRFYKVKKDIILRVLFFSYTLVVLGFLSDNIKLSEFFIESKLPIPYFDRYSSFQFLLLSIFYLAHQFSEDAITALRVRTAEELSLQAAHDIQSPLAAITVAMKSVSNHQSIPQESKDLVFRAIDRIRSIISSLKEAESRKLNLAVISSKEFLQELVDEKRYQFKSNELVSIQLKIMKFPSSDCIRVDSIEFARVISNLINNAVESAMPNKEIKVIVSIGSNKKVVEISIVDNGRGMDKHLLKVIGQRGTSSGKPGGMGLGVYHAKKQIESWGGKLKIESRVNKGSKVSILLPCKKV
jgi:signal transduction histidine kinase